MPWKVCKPNKITCSNIFTLRGLSSSPPKYRLHNHCDP